MQSFGPILEPPHALQRLRWSWRSLSQFTSTLRPSAYLTLVTAFFEVQKDRRARTLMNPTTRASSRQSAWSRV